MKKIIFLLIIFVSGVSHAQFPVWVNGFDSAADLEGWTFHDLNNNGNNWQQGSNWRNGETGTEQVLRYTMFSLPGDIYPNADTENDWIISPAIDLSSASGTIQLAIYWNKVYSNQNNASGRLVFISTSPDLAGFQELQLQGNQGYYFVADDVVFPTNPNEFAESIVDISTFAGSTIYIGLLSTNNNDYTFQTAPINIDQMGVFASTLSVKDINAKDHTEILQNPVVGSLQLQLNPALERTTTAVKIYNMLGQEVLTTVYNDQIEVSALAAGAYIIHVTNGTLTEKLRFIKK